MVAKTPTKLSAKARAIWTGITRDYELRADELRVLEDACREVDLIERLELELRDSKLVVEGSMGQPVASPLVQEIRQHRATLARLFAALKLPADEGGSGAGEGSPGPGGGDASRSARAAAQARWSRGA